MRVLSRLYNPIVKNSKFLSKISLLYTKTQVRKVSLNHQLCNSNKPEWGSKKAHRTVKLQLLEHQKMTNPKIEEILAPLRQIVKEQVSWNFYNLISNWMTQAQWDFCNFHCCTHLHFLCNRTGSCFLLKKCCLFFSGRLSSSIKDRWST